MGKFKLAKIGKSKPALALNRRRMDTDEVVQQNIFRDELLTNIQDDTHTYRNQIHLCCLDYLP